MNKTYLLASPLMCILCFVLHISCKKGELISSVKPAADQESPAKQVGGGSVDPVESFDSNIQSGLLSAYFYVINPGKMTIVNDPVYGSKRKVVYFNVKNTDNAGLTANPRAQLESPKQYVEGQNIWVGLSVYFSNMVYTKWLDFAEVYGPPYAGAAPFRLIIERSNITAVSFDGEKESRLWSEPLKTGVWYDFVYRELLSKDKGEVEVFVRRQGEKKFSQVVTTTVQPTLTAANSAGANYSKVSCYWDKENTWTDSSKEKKLISAQMYLTNHKVGSNFNEVAPAYIIND